MSEADKNLEIVRRGYAAFNAGDLQALAEIFAEDAAWHTPGRSSMAGDRKGQADVFALFGRFGSETAGTFKATLLHLLRGEDGSVVGVHRNTGERNGKRLDVGCCILFELKDGRVTDGREYFYDAHAWDEFWA